MPPLTSRSGARRPVSFPNQAKPFASPLTVGGRSSGYAHATGATCLVSARATTESLARKRQRKSTFPSAIGAPAARRQRPARTDMSAILPASDGDLPRQEPYSTSRLMPMRRKPRSGKLGALARMWTRRTRRILSGGERRVYCLAARPTSLFILTSPLSLDVDRARFGRATKV